MKRFLFNLKGYTRTFAFKIFSVYLVIMLAMLAVTSWVNYSYHQRYYNMLAAEYSDAIVYRLGADLDRRLRGGLEILSSLNYQQQLQNCITSPIPRYEKETVLSIVNISDMSDFTSQLTNTENDIDSLYIFCNSGKLLFLSETMPDSDILALLESNKFRETPWYALAGSARGRCVFQERVEGFQPDPQYYYMLRSLRAITSGKDIGVAVARMDRRELERLCLDYQLNGLDRFVLIDPDGAVQYATDSERAGQMIREMESVQSAENGSVIHKIGGTDYLLTQHTAAYTDWKIIRYVPLHVAFEPINAFRTIVQWLIGFGIAAMFVLFFISQAMSKPISQLVGGMHRIERGDFDVELPTNDRSEMHALFSGFNTMAGNLRTLVWQVYESEMEQKEAQLRALQSQINPHFLYNTLNSIQLVAILNQDYKASQMIVALSKMFRYATVWDSHTVSLREEMGNVENYIFLQQIRFEDAFRFEMDIPERLMDRCIPKMTIQPIIENSISHGMKARESGGVIRLEGDESELGYLIRVRDNGAGIPPERVRPLQEMLAGGRRQDHGSQSIGLLNVNARLKALYGESSGVAILHTGREGTVIQIMIADKGR